ncbi:kinase-like domain-containing protein [Annulohypoxylon truncatum]|uniref:kinase-like domain-containing protein n=1 Tax=Annulohypoxylon truncatum TaxID=327061 RepID=UPI002007E97A|nr:kinase-like domain-containing protein [Annulohypoxylon truncatum]KAI1209432.1 kinase-like domain-containing protein [Annulohypoxylon truncatum]
MIAINMPSRTSTTEDDGADQIGYDTPRSGIATPQPDLHDKRLPGISYFGQVSTTSLPSAVGLSSSRALETESTRPTCPQEEKESHIVPQQLPSPESDLSGKDITPDTSPLLSHERIEPLAKVQSSQQLTSDIHPYPTPPCSQTPSERGVKLSDASGDSDGAASGPSNRSSLNTKSGSETSQLKVRRATLASPLTSIVTTSNVLASHLSIPTDHAFSTTPSSPSDAQPPAGEASSFLSQSASVDRLKKLTDVGTKKSGPPTPTRTLSATHSSHTEERSPSKLSGDGIDTGGRQTPVSSASGGAQAPPQRGKLTIKILEARGLRKSRDPYVVAVFQRSELISHGPRTFEDEDESAAPAPVPMGGVPIQRQGSDPGRSMAIPMRSRQSSNTSITDYNTFRNRPRRSFTSPKWDAEAVFDVVDSDMLVDISIYDHGTQGEEFLGHVDFQAIIPGKDEPVRGWYPLRGNLDTTPDKTPTGEIFVEAIYQRTEKKHYGPDDFQILRLIGKGTFGQVYQVRKKDTGRIYAMKVLSKKVIVQKKEVAHTVGERNILVRTAMSESPFIVGLKFSFQTQNDLFLVTDYMSGGELFWHLQKEGRFDEKRAKFYIAELILAIQHLHNNDIVYRDLKPENILLDANGHIALCDFGLSKANLTQNDTTNTFCGTTEYLAPEVLLDEAGYTKMVDFWSLGVLVFEMCCGWSPFYAEDTQQMYKNIAFGKVRFPRDTLSQEGRNFVKGLLNRNPKHRLGAIDDAEELKRHAFFADVDWDILSKKLITPPFKPKLKSETDVSYFDPEFTNALNSNGSLNERAQQLAAGFATSTPLSPTTQANFQGFTFVDESSLDDHMRGRYVDEEMDDADHRDNDWDDLEDLDLRKANRMSGIVKTGNNDEPFGESHFDI